VGQFQSTRPRGARQRRVDQKCIIPLFQSTRPRGARRTIVDKFKKIVCFNPRAREGRDVNVYSSLLASKVSIHAPARGATQYGIYIGNMAGFQSTRPRGARPAHPVLQCAMAGFNPRAREGRDIYTIFGLCRVYVSIHAPARGATLC